MKTSTSQFEPRVRFNWGYHDAQGTEYISVQSYHDTQRTRDWAAEHFDKHYGAGFIAGLNDKELGRYNGSSEQAWRQRL